MQRLSIQCLNVALLVIIFIGLPAVTQAQLGPWHISPARQSQWLMFWGLWGLALAAAGNAVAALGLIKGRKERKLCWEWTAVFIGLLFVQYACLRGYFNFNWLKQTLLWLQTLPISSRPTAILLGPYSCSKKYFYHGWTRIHPTRLAPQPQILTADKR